MCTTPHTRATQLPCTCAQSWLRAHTLTAQLNPAGLGKRPETVPGKKHDEKKQPTPVCRAGGQGHAQTGFLITYLKPWLLPKQRNGASDLDKRGRAIIHVNRLHRRETEGERYSLNESERSGPGNEIWLLRPDTSQRESGRGLGRPLPSSLPGPLPRPEGQPQLTGLLADPSLRGQTEFPQPDPPSPKAPGIPPHQLQEQKQMGSGT